MDALVRTNDDHDPALAFVNLGDVDRFGHADLTGSSIRLLRTLVLINTDAQLASFAGPAGSAGRRPGGVLQGRLAVYRPTRPHGDLQPLPEERT